MVLLIHRQRVHHTTHHQERHRQLREDLPEQQGESGSEHTSSDTAEQLYPCTLVHVPAGGWDNRHACLTMPTTGTVARFS